MILVWVVWFLFIVICWRYVRCDLVSCVAYLISWFGYLVVILLFSGVFRLCWLVCLVLLL